MLLQGQVSKQMTRCLVPFPRLARRAVKTAQKRTEARKDNMLIHLHNTLLWYAYNFKCNFYLTIVRKVGKCQRLLEQLRKANCF
eukprot:g10178.t1